MSKASHYFVIPGLLHLSALDLAFLSTERYPLLTRFFQHARCYSSPDTQLDAVLCKRLGCRTKVLPLVQHFSDMANTLIATPVILKSDINSTWIQPALASEHTAHIMRDMADFFAEDLTILEHIDEHYIVHFKQVRVMSDLPHYLTVLGKKVDPYLYAIREHLSWFKLVNEIQMFLHGHALNQTPEGQLLFNSLWFWGGESTQCLTHNTFIRSDDQLLQLTLSEERKFNQERIIIKLDLLKYLKLNSPVALEAFFFSI